MQMSTVLRQWVREGRFGGLAWDCTRLLRQGVSLLEIPTPDPEQLLRRISTMERDIILPVKLACLAMLLVPVFRHWLGGAMDELHIDVAEWTRYLLWYYVPINVIIAGVLLALRRLPLGLVQWAVFVSGLLDIIVLSALTVFTAGEQSFSYWLFLALILRSAVSVPRATSQLALHVTIIISYVMTGLMMPGVGASLEAEARNEQKWRKAESHKAEIQRYRELHPGEALALAPSASGAHEVSPTPGYWIDESSGHPPPASRAHEINPAAPIAPEGRGAAIVLESQAEPLMVRLVLLVSVSVCSYGVQVLLERQRKAEEEAREAALRQGQVHAAGRLAAEFAHQIKNPLAVINNAAYSAQRALKQGRPVGPEQIQIIQEEVERSDRIITDIMGYAQLSEGRVEKLDVAEELDHAIGQVFPPAAGYPIRVHRDYASDFPPLLMLRRHVSEAFINLLQNAREALEGRSGNIWVSARCHKDLSIEVAIADDGPGIPPDKREQIFEAYYTTKKKGTGLGLATVKHNVELYGGSVRVESELGKGARFILVFPAKTLIKLAKQP